MAKAAWASPTGERPWRLMAQEAEGRRRRRPDVHSCFCQRTRLGGTGWSPRVGLDGVGFGGVAVGYQAPGLSAPGLRGPVAPSPLLKKPRRHRSLGTTG